MSSRCDRGKRSTRKEGGGWDEFGGYMAAKIQKLENQFEKEKGDSGRSSLSNIFNGISIFVNGYTKPSSDVLKKLMQRHGGVFHHYYSRAKVTHIIASNLPTSKVANLTDKKVCHPDWITDSIKAEKLLPYQGYLLYKAETKRQPSIKLTCNADQTNKEMDSTTNEPDVCGDQKDDSSNEVKDSEPANNSKATPTSSRSLFHDESKETKDREKDIQDIEMNADAIRCASPTVIRSPAKAGDPNFVSEFYNNSRLHHISTWGSEMKAYVKTLQAVPSKFEAREKLIQVVKDRGVSTTISDEFGKARERIIMHIDMDSFFVSVGLRNRPELVGKPVAVTHSKGGTSKAAEKAGHHGSMAEIASCSYEAREFGVKNGMFLGGARKMCPDIVCIPYDFAGYSEVSHKLYDLVSSYTHAIEAVSCDEMFIDCTQILADTGATPLEFASLLREEIKEASRCNASAGLGVGRTIRDRLVSIGVSTCADLQRVALATLQKELGNKTGQTLYNYSRGKDDRVIQTEKARKSVSAEINYGIRFTKAEDAEKFIGELAEEVAKRLTAISAKGKCITLKLKVRQIDAPLEPAKFMGHGRCDNMAKSVNLTSMTDSATLITTECISLLKTLHAPAVDIRGMGIQVNKLDIGESDTGAAGVRSILQFTTKIQKRADQNLAEKSNITDKQQKASPFKIPEPKPKELPPLPKLDVSSQRLPLLEFDSACDTGIRSKASNRQSPAGSSESEISRNFWPSASQIDENVLSELPLEIQEEIRQATKKQQKTTISDDTVNVALGSASEEPGCSHWEPEEVHQSMAVKMPVFKQAPATPKKAVSPRKSPAGKGRRPRKVQAAPLKSVAKIAPPAQSNEMTTTCDTENLDSESRDTAAEPPPNRVSLCGAVTLPEVKQLLKQWLQDSPEPCDEDVERVLEYAALLVQDHNIEQLLMMLRFLHRLARQQNRKWIKAVEQISKQSSAIVHSVYGSKLKI